MAEFRSTGSRAVILCGRRFQHDDCSSIGSRLREGREKFKMREVFYRHTLPVRVMHWINAIVLVIMFMSGLADFQRPSGALLGQIGHPTSITRSCR
jgi:hypothetical protein